jgi:tetratricopeptide (TPR) repeat protein
LASCDKYQEVDRVKILVEEKKYDEAFKEAKKEQNLIKKFNYLGIIYSKKGDLKNAEISYNEVLKKDAKNFKALYNLAILKTKTRSFKESLVILGDLEKLRPKDTNIKIKKAWNYYYLLANSNAIDILKNLVDNNRKNLEIYQWVEISDLYARLERYEAAAEAYDYYISKAKENKLKINFEDAKRHVDMLRSERNQKL